MRKLLLGSAIALFGLVNAQKVNFGANAGMLTGFASLKTPMGNDSDSNTGFYAGIFAEINAGNKFKIQPAVNYANIENATGWDKVPTTIGWDASGFQASAAGFRERNGVFYEKDKLGLWWTKNHHNEQNAMYILMKNVSTDSTKEYQGINISHIGRTAGLSVRCVRKYSADNAQKELVDTVASAIADSLLLSAKK